MSFYLDFKRYRYGKLVSQHWEYAHSWTYWAWIMMIRSFLFRKTSSISGNLFKGNKSEHNVSIVVGDSDVAFNVNQKRLQNQLIIEATETDQENYMLQYLESAHSITYNSIDNLWEVSIERGFYVISSNLGGYDVTIKEIGLYPNSGPMWARDVLGSPITVTPLDTLYITYNINTDFSTID